MLISLFYTRNSNNEVVQGDEGPGISKHEKPKSPASNLRKLALHGRGKIDFPQFLRGKDEKDNDREEGEREKEKESEKLRPKNFSDLQIGELYSILIIKK